MRRWLTIISLLVVPFFLTGCGLKKPAKTTLKSPAPTVVTQVSPSPTAPKTTLLTLEPTQLDPTFQVNKDLADKKVKDWKADAVLYQVAVKLPPNLSVGQITEVLTYGSPTDAYNWWTMTISEKTGKSIRAIIPKEDFLGTTLQPVPTKFWQINAIEALQLADVNGGAAFRLKHPDAQVTINLAVSQPKNFLWYSVEYETATAEPLKILVNPSTKEIEGLTPTPTPTPSSTAQ